MDPARREQLLKTYGSSLRVNHGRYLMGNGCVAEMYGGVLEDDRADLAALLCEAWNAHFGERPPSQALSIAYQGFVKIARLAGLSKVEKAFDSEVEDVVDQVTAWKRDSEELAAIRKNRAVGKAATFDFIAKICSLGEEEPLVNAVTQVKTWKAKAEALDAIRQVGKDDDPDLSPAFERAFEQASVDLLRQDCRRAAVRLAGLFDWSPTEAKLAGEILFMELRRREVTTHAEKPDFMTATKETAPGLPPAIRQFADSVRGALGVVGPCPASSSVHGKCERSYGHGGFHITQGVAWGDIAGGGME